MTRLSMALFGCIFCVAACQASSPDNAEAPAESGLRCEHSIFDVEAESGLESVADDPGDPFATSPQDAITSFVTEHALVMPAGTDVEVTDRVWRRQTSSGSVVARFDLEQLPDGGWRMLRLQACSPG